MTHTFADLSIDLDNKWSYLKTHGDVEWTSYPSYLDAVVPHVLEVLRKYQLTITFFVVGQDAALDANQDAFSKIVQAGHEIGNHSFHHEPWLQRYSRSQLETEFDLAEAAMRRITPQKLVGFRGPGYSLSTDVLEILSDRGYLYDCSTLPTFIGPAARAYYFLRSRLTREQVEDRKQLFGSIKDGFRRLRPYRWKTGNGTILEIPVSTIPALRTPFHFSYLLYLAQYSEELATAYFRCALWLCKLSGLGPSMLLHPLDFLGKDDVKGLEFFPAMNMLGEQKRQFMSRMLGIYVRSFRVMNMASRARILSASNDLRLPVVPASCVV